METEPTVESDGAGNGQQPAAARAWASFSAQGGFVKILIGSVTAASTAVLTAMILALPGVVSSWIDGSDDDAAVAAPQNDTSTSIAEPSAAAADVQVANTTTTTAMTVTTQVPTTNTVAAPEPGDRSVGSDGDALVLANQLEQAGFYYADTSFFTVVADSSSPSSSPGVDYEASNVIDGNPETAWQEGVKGSGELGVGSTLSFEFDDELGFGYADFEIVDVYAGWQSGQPCLYERHARPTEVLVEAQASPMPEWGDLWVPVWTARSQPLTAADGRSLLRVQLPATSYSSMRLTVTAVEPGASCDGQAPFDDMLISEVQFADFEFCDFSETPYTDEQVAGYDVARYPGPGPHVYFPDGYDSGGVGC
jgi:hypothetical protein